MISVLMATYNGEIFIGDQLRSLADQTEPPAELVVCDDGSSDNTVEIVRAFEREAPFPVRLLVNETRRGYRANFLNGARACTEEYIAFCDQDDVWVKDKIAIVSRKLKETDATVLLHGYRLIDSEGAVISGDIDYAGLKPIAAEPAVTLRGDIHGMTQIFHRKIVDYNDLWSLSVNQWFENERMEHDEWVIFIGSLLGRIEFIDDVLNLYRQHGKNALGIQGAAPSVAPIDAGKAWRLNMSRIGDRSQYDSKCERVEAAVRRMGLAYGTRAAIAKAVIRQSGKDSGMRDRHIEYYLSEESYSAARLSCYAPSSRAARIGAFAANCARGAYLRRGKRGLRDGAVDFLYGATH